MAEETAWQQALRYANRANPYPFYDELRKTPVARQPDGSYVVSTYRELVQLLHDPRVSSDHAAQPPEAGRSAAGPTTRAYAEPIIIATDPPEHDRMRRQVMRHFGPPDAPRHDRRHGAGDPPHRHRAAGRHRRARPGSTSSTTSPIPVPVTVICKILGVPLEDDPTLPRLDRGSPGRARPRPGGERPESEQRRAAAGHAQAAELDAVPGRADRAGTAKQPGAGHALGDGQRRRPGGTPVPRSRSSATRCCCSSPGMRPRST